MDDGIDNNPYSPTTTQTDSSPFQTTGTVAETLKQFARTGQIITFALANGMVVIGAVFIFLRAGSDQETSLDLFFLIGLGVLATNLVLAFLLPAMMRSNAISRFRDTDEVSEMRSTHVLGDEHARQRQQWIDWNENTAVPRPMQQLLLANQSANLVGQALLEGAAVINLVFSFINGSLLHLPVAAVGLIGVLTMVPTIGKLRRFVTRGLDVSTQIGNAP